MKIAINWVISLFAAACILFMVGVFWGRHTYSSIQNPRNSTNPPVTISAVEKVNINFADVDQLQDLPGIGRTLAERIVNFRETNGPFVNTYQLKLVEGIGDKKLNDIIHLICVGETP